MENWLEITMWSCVAIVVLVTLGYPAFLALIGPIARRPWRQEDAEPSVTLIIAAYNEESGIERKLLNTLALDYPRDRLEIMVASDGSSDRTNDIVKSFADRGIQLLAYPRTGKTGCQNLAAKAARGDILVFSDANAAYHPQAIRKLVRNFADREVGCAVGQLVYESSGNAAGDCEDSYWTYEKFMKVRESQISSLIGANGSIYAVRRDAYVELDLDLISDFCEPLALVREGYRVVYEHEAVSVEEASDGFDVEFRRKVRILTRSIRGLLRMRVLLNPFRYGWFAVQLAMHKLMRFLTPLFLIGGAAALTALAALGQYRWLFAAAVVGLVGTFAVVAQARRTGSKNAVVRVCYLAYYYLMVNYALVLAWINIFKGRRMTVWAPERKGA